MTIAIVNHKGGTGKTTTTINLGSALARMGYDVLLVDFDAQGSLSYSLGVSDRAPTVADVILGDVSVEQILVNRENMDILPAGLTLADVELTLAKTDNRLHHLSNVLAEVKNYDFIFIDCPPSLSLLTLNALTASDYVIVPMRMDVLALRGLDSMLEILKRMEPLNPEIGLLGVLPVMAFPRKKIYQEIMSHIKENYGVRVFEHAIHTSVKAAEAPSFGKSVVNYAPACSTACDYSQFANEFLTLTAEVSSRRSPYPQTNLKPKLNNSIKWHSETT